MGSGNKDKDAKDREVTKREKRHLGIFCGGRVVHAVCRLRVEDGVYAG